MLFDSGCEGGGRGKARTISPLRSPVTSPLRRSVVEGVHLGSWPLSSDAWSCLLGRVVRGGSAACLGAKG